MQTTVALLFKTTGPTTFNWSESWKGVCLWHVLQRFVIQSDADKLYVITLRSDACLQNLLISETKAVRTPIHAEFISLRLAHPDVQATVKVCLSVHPSNQVASGLTD
jgi:hypothetical protein